MTDITLKVTALLAFIGFLAVTRWMIRTSVKVWKEEPFSLGLVGAWVVYFVVLGSAYGKSIWEALEPHRWREWGPEWLQILGASATMWAVVIAVLFLLSLILYAVSVARGTNDDEGLGFGRLGRPVERLVEHLFARRKAKPDTSDPRGPKRK